MQSYADIRKSIHNFLLNPSSSPADTNAFLQQLENQVFDICVSFSSTINEKNSVINEKNSVINEKNNELIKTLRERIDLSDQLVKTKESISALIKCYNMFMKAASHTIARTIVEMTAREYAHSIYSSVEKLMHRFRLERNLRDNKTIIELIREAKTRSFWTKLTEVEQNNLNCYIKWNYQVSNNKNFVPTNDVLKDLWRKLKPTDLVASLTHPKFGSFTEKVENIEKSFINLYHTLSKMVHNAGHIYEDNKLPIPDLSDDHFSRSDALALATFYKIALPNIEYEFATNVVYLSADSLNLLNDINLNNSMNMHTTAAMSETNELSLKRKLSDQSQENKSQ